LKQTIFSGVNSDTAKVNFWGLLQQDNLWHDYLVLLNQDHTSTEGIKMNFYIPPVLNATVMMSEFHHDV